MILGAVALGWASAVASTTLWAALRSGGAGLRVPHRPSRVVVLRPCAGVEPRLLESLASRPASARRFVIRFAVADDRDAALPFVRAAAAALARDGIDVGVVFTGAIGPNRKVDQLARALTAERGAHDVVVVADSDVDLGGVDLDELVGPVAHGDAAACWAAPLEVDPRTAADRASAAVLDASLHAFALLGALDRRGLVGKLFAVDARALESVGGFAALRHHLGEDLELARRLTALGHELALAPCRAPSLAQGRSWDDVVARYARWIAVVRAQRPHLLPAYPLLFALPPLAAFAAGAAVVDGALGAVALALALGARLGAAVLARLRNDLDVEPARLPVDVLLADLVLLAAWLRALGSRDLKWRGRSLRIGPSGVLSACEPREDRLREGKETARPLFVEPLEPVGDSADQGLVDPGELGRDQLLVARRLARGVAKHRAGVSAAPHRDPQVRLRPRPVLVAKTDRDHAGAAGDARDLAAAAPERQPPRRDRDLAPLREEPHEAPRCVEQARRVADRAGSVGAIAEVDPEGADAREERQPPQVVGVHHRVRIGPQIAQAELEQHERVPPRRVVGHDEDRPRRQRVAERGETTDADRGEARVEPALGVPGEPSAEQGALLRGDHGDLGPDEPGALGAPLGSGA